MYTIFWKRGNRRPNLDFRPQAPCPRCEKVVEAIQTWKKPTRWGRYRAQYFYRCPNCHKEVTPFYYAAFNAIDFTIPAERIGDRKRPLRPKTLERVRYGWDTYGKKPLIVTGRYTTGINFRVRDAIEEPLPTQPGDASHAVVLPWLVKSDFTQGNGHYTSSSGEAWPTQTARQSIGLVGFLSKQYGGTQTTCQDVGLVCPSFIAEMHGTSKAAGIDEPLMCLTAGGGHHALLSADAFLTYYYGNQQSSRMNDPVCTVTGTDRAGLVGALESLTIEDLTFRMLQPHEIGAAMAFPGQYIVLGSSRDKVKQLGNAVTPPVMHMLLERCKTTLL